MPILVEQFQQNLSMIETRLNKGILVGKELKMEHRLRDSSASAMTTEVGDMMDLKAEIVSLKNKLFMAD